MNNYSRRDIIEKAPFFSLDKEDFIIMLNIMYEDQYLTYFKQKYNYKERDYYKMGDEEYLNKNGDNGYLDVKDVKVLEQFIENTNFEIEKSGSDSDSDSDSEDEIIKEYYKNRNPRYNLNLIYKIKYLTYKRFVSLKENLMSERYPFIERSNVIYEISKQYSSSYLNILFYRKFVLFDPINKNYFIPYYYDDKVFVYRKIFTKKI